MGQDFVHQIWLTLSHGVNDTVHLGGVVHRDPIGADLLTGLINTRLPCVEPAYHTLDCLRRRVDAAVVTRSNQPVPFPVLQDKGLARSLVRGQQVLGKLIELPLLIEFLLTGYAVPEIAGASAL